MTLYFMQNWVYVWVDFRSFPNLSQEWLKFKKIRKEKSNFGQNVPQNSADWYMNGWLLLLKLMYVSIDPLSNFQRYIPTKTKL